MKMMNWKKFGSAVLMLFCLVATSGSASAWLFIPMGSRTGLLRNDSPRGVNDYSSQEDAAMECFERHPDLERIEVRDDNGKTTLQTFTRASFFLGDLHRDAEVEHAKVEHAEQE